MASLTFLIIEDSPTMRQLIRFALNRIPGAEVVEASDGVDGLKKLSSNQVDLILTDINMPRLNGKSLCERTDHLKKDRDFLTIVLTARISGDERRWIENMHQTRFMEKPFSPSKLVDCIKQYFDDR